MTGKYVCGLCGGTFDFVNDATWDKEVEEEYKRNFPKASKENRDIVCDDCWKIVRPIVNDSTNL